MKLLIKLLNNTDAEMGNQDTDAVMGNQVNVAVMGNQVTYSIHNMQQTILNKRQELNKEMYLTCWEAFDGISAGQTRFSNCIHGR